MEPQVWHTLVVRLWRDGDGLKVRFLASQTGRTPTSRLATSLESAARQFELWLRSTDPDAESFDDGEAPARRTTPLERRSRRGDDGGATDAKTSPS
ncbi:MAG: hypothetical protein JWR85_3183 [Marmoricola sp.]|nr:hypothetical protein [Marmoricola sp.]